jgi:hypothetical protein
MSSTRRQDRAEPRDPERPPASRCDCLWALRARCAVPDRSRRGCDGCCVGRAGHVALVRGRLGAARALMEAGALGGGGGGKGGGRLDARGKGGQNGVWNVRVFL